MQLTNAKLWIVFGGAFCFLSVALGAFGAHALQSRLNARDFEIFQTAVYYQFLHAIAIFAVGLWLSTLSRTGTMAAAKTAAAGALFLGVGIFVFSGSLYTLVLTGKRWLGAVTPVGGLSFLVGWLWLVRAGLKL